MLAFGKNTLFMTEPKKIKKVYVHKGKSDFSLFQYLKENHIPYILVEGNLLNKMCKQNHQGIVFEREEYSYHSLDSILDKDFLVLLDHIEDPHNFGAIVRTCEAFSVGGIIIPKDRSVSVTDTVIKTSVGTTDSISIVKVTNLVDTIKKLKNAGYFIYGSSMDGKDVKKESFSTKKVLIIGNEGKGISPLVRKHCDVVLSIPMSGSVNSLNASCAAAILIFEMGGIS